MESLLPRGRCTLKAAAMNTSRWPPFIHRSRASRQGSKCRMRSVQLTLPHPGNIPSESNCLLTARVPWRVIRSNRPAKAFGHFLMGSAARIRLRLPVLAAALSMCWKSPKLPIQKQASSSGSGSQPLRLIWGAPNLSQRLLASLSPQVIRNPLMYF